MGEVLALSDLLETRQLWHGRAGPAPADGVPTGWPVLDALLPHGGWPAAAISEILLPLDGVGELQLLLPALARLACAARPLLVVAPPYLPCVAGWAAQGLDMRHVVIVAAPTPNDALWAMEQGLRSAACAAVVGWPAEADDRALRRLQLAADSGRTPAFVLRDRRHAAQASPAALRVELEPLPPRLRVRKCRGATPPAQPVPLALWAR